MTTFNEDILESNLLDLYQTHKSTELPNRYQIWRDDNPTLPALFVMAESSEQEENTYNHIVNVQISVVSHCEDTSGDAHAALESAMREVINADDITSDLSDNGIIVMTWQPRTFSRSVQDGRRISMVTAEAYLCGTASP